MKKRVDDCETKPLHNYTSGGYKIETGPPKFHSIPLSAVVLGDLRQSDLLIGEKAERNYFLEGRAVLSAHNCKITQSNQRRPGGLTRKTRPFLSRNSSLLVGAMKDRQHRGRRGGRGKEGHGAGWAGKLFFFLSRHFYSKTSLRCSTYYGAQNCLMCLFLLLMQQASRKTGYGSPRESAVQ